MGCWELSEWTRTGWVVGNWGEWTGAGWAVERWGEWTGAGWAVWSCDDLIRSWGEWTGAGWAVGTGVSGSGDVSSGFGSCGEWIGRCV